MPKPILGYWDIRGLAEPSRLMLEFSGVDYEDKRYQLTDKDKWFQEKLTLGLDFPNLPYYFDGEVKVTESFAIMKYIGKQCNLLPNNDAEKVKCDVAEGVVTDVRGSFVMMCYQPNFEANKKNFFEVTFPTKMATLEKYLGGNKWLAGGSLTYIDFAFCEFLDHVRTMESTAFDKYPNVNEYLERFFKNEKIAAYRQSSRFQKLPINGNIANWGGKKEL